MNKLIHSQLKKTARCHIAFSLNIHHGFELLSNMTRTRPDGSASAMQAEVMQRARKEPAIDALPLSRQDKQANVYGAIGEPHGSGNIRQA
ncbi:hypothetical protein LG204_01600 [Methylovorus menthalis]|uniref:hypothetical protein n=1 Tax=Methylovorus menthalis TaxID=1002227 RepID=UPI001E2E92BE|nr:hypothetical protein [Methylovorus menthalis]MCB4810006.1 hypothetical protein [Methylovorus menthalis]